MDYEYLSDIGMPAKKLEEGPLLSGKKVEAMVDNYSLTISGAKNLFNRLVNPCSKSPTSGRRLSLVFNRINPNVVTDGFDRRDLFLHFFPSSDCNNP